MASRWGSARVRSWVEEHLGFPSGLSLGLGLEVCLGRILRVMVGLGWCGAWRNTRFLCKKLSMWLQIGGACQHTCPRGSQSHRGPFPTSPSVPQQPSLHLPDRRPGLGCPSAPLHYLPPSWLCPPPGPRSLAGQPPGSSWANGSVESGRQQMFPGGFSLGFLPEQRNHTGRFHIP